MKILVLNGVNLGRLGKRQPEIYGFDTLRALNKRLKRYASAKNITLKFFQTDSEPALLKKINRVSLDAIILNAGAWSHYSYAVRDAVAACCLLMKLFLSIFIQFRKNHSTGQWYISISYPLF